jgi:hypothetical protein
LNRRHTAKCKSKKRVAHSLAVEVVDNKSYFLFFFLVVACHRFFALLPSKSGHNTAGATNKTTFFDNGQAKATMKTSLSRKPVKKACQIFHCLVWLIIFSMSTSVMLTLNFHKSANSENHEAARKVQYTVLDNGRRSILPQRRYPKVIYFVHVHKSAGSFICKQA